VIADVAVDGQIVGGEGAVTETLIVVVEGALIDVARDTPDHPLHADETLGIEAPFEVPHYREDPIHTFLVVTADVVDGMTEGDHLYLFRHRPHLHGQDQALVHHHDVAITRHRDLAPHILADVVAQADPSLPIDAAAVIEAEEAEAEEEAQVMEPVEDHQHLPIHLAPSHQGPASEEGLSPIQQALLRRQGPVDAATDEALALALDPFRAHGHSAGDPAGNHLAAGPETEMTMDSTSLRHAPILVRVVNVTNVD
jgi:hypothetical protein